MEAEIKIVKIEKRIAAFIIDYLVAFLVTVTLIGCSFVLYGFSETQIVNYISTSIYLFSLLIVLKDIAGGSSIGKRFLKIKIIERERAEKKPRLLVLILRNLTILIWPIEFIFILISKNKERLGDKLFKTIVIQI